MTNRLPFAKLAALAVAVSMLAGALVYIPHSRAADTPNEWFDEIIGAPADVTFHDVEWTPDGEWALWVGSDISGVGCAWWYEAATDMWTQPVVEDDVSGAAGMELQNILTICYIPSHPSYDECFMVMGDDNWWGYGAFYFLRFTDKGALYENHMPEVEQFVAHESVLDTFTNCVIVVGSGNLGAMCFKYFIGSEYFGIGPLCYDNSDTGNAWFDIALDTGMSPPDYYFVGKHDHQPTRGGDGGGIFNPTPDYQMWDASTSTKIALGLPAGMAFINCLEWDAGGGRMVLAAESYTEGVHLYSLVRGGSTRYDAFYAIQDTLDDSSIIWDMDFDLDGNGVMVGEWYDDVSMNAYGLVTDIWWDGVKYTVVPRSDTSGIFLNEPLYGIALVPVGNPVAMVCGSAFKYHYTAASSNIQVDTLFPHIDYLELYNAGTSVSVLNSQVDVDPGDYSTYYDLVVRAWHNSGKENLLQVDVYLWYDWGASEAIPAPFDQLGNENSRIHLRWTRGAPDTWIRWENYGGSNEATLDVANCLRTDDAGSDNITLRFRFSPHQQIHYASGQGGLPFPFFEPAGDRYGTGASEQQSTTSALNSINSWNIRADVMDSGGALANAYDEFGIFRYTYIGTSGLPGGGNVVGSGPPNTVIQLAPFGAQVTYAANCPYQLTLSTTDLTGQLFGGTITADSLSVTGGQLVMNTFPAAGTPVYLYGSSLPSWEQPYPMYTTTLITWVGNAVTIYCDIPSVAEDYYRGTLTYSLLHG